MLDPQSHGLSERSYAWLLLSCGVGTRTGKGHNVDGFWNLLLNSVHAGIQASSWNAIEFSVMFHVQNPALFFLCNSTYRSIAHNKPNCTCSKTELLIYRTGKQFRPNNCLKVEFFTLTHILGSIIQINGIV